MALRVLLADESTTIKKVMQLALQDFGVEVKTVPLGVDVVEVAKAFKPDIIFADVLLQKRNGYEVAADLKRDPQLTSTPVVLMWSSFMELDEDAARNSRAEGRLEKPFDVENLRQVVLELVPRTQSQRLAHFLKYPASANESLQKDEAIRRDVASNDATVPVGSKASTVTQKIPADTGTKTVRAEPAAKPAPAPKPPPLPEIEPEPMIEIEDEKSPSWSMESFDDIESFAAEEEAAAPAESGLQFTTDDDDDAEGDFGGFQITPPARPKPAETTGVRNQTHSGLSVADERDPWSHQDLSRFKLDLPPVEVGTIEEPQDAGSSGLEVATSIRTAPDEWRAEDVKMDDSGELPSLEIDDHVPGDEIDMTPDANLEIDANEEEELPAPRGGRIPQLSSDRLEEIIRAQSREIIEDVVRKIVPDIASDLIRKELERLLEDSAVRANPLATEGTKSSKELRR